MNVRRAIPLLIQEGWTRHQEEVAKPPLTERTGWSRMEPPLKTAFRNTSSIPTTPSAPLRWLRIFFLMAQPPLLCQEGSGTLTRHIEVDSYMQSHLSSSTRALFQIHFCVFLWGFTAILGKAITLSALPLVWWRMLMVTGALMLMPRFWRGFKKMPRQAATIYLAIGLVVASHWVTFYASIK